MGNVALDLWGPVSYLEIRIRLEISLSVINISVDIFSGFVRLSTLYSRDADGYQKWWCIFLNSDRVNKLTCECHITYMCCFHLMIGKIQLYFQLDNLFATLFATSFSLSRTSRPNNRGRNSTTS